MHSFAASWKTVFRPKQLIYFFALGGYG